MSVPRAVRILLQVYDNVFTLDEYIQHKWSVQLTSERAIALAPFLNETLVATMEQDDLYSEPRSFDTFSSVVQRICCGRRLGEDDLPPDVISSYLLMNEKYLLVLFNHIAASIRGEGEEAGPLPLTLLYQFLKSNTLFTCLGNENVIQRTGK